MDQPSSEAQATGIEVAKYPFTLKVAVTHVSFIHKTDTIIAFAPWTLIITYHPIVQHSTQSLTSSTVDLRCLHFKDVNYKISEFRKAITLCGMRERGSKGTE